MSVSWITDSVADPSKAADSEALALACGSEPAITYGELRAREMSFANALRRAGVGMGDRVALLLFNSTDFVAYYLAIARLGAISVRLNWRLTAAELSFQLDDSEASLLVFDSDFESAIGEIRGALRLDRLVERGETAAEWAMPEAQFLEGGTEEIAACGSLDDPVSLMYTSGTTGLPKGALWTHGNTLWFAAMQAMKWTMGPDTVTMSPGPMFHAGGLEVLTMAALFAHGTAVAFPSRGVRVPAIVDAIRVHQVNQAMFYSFMAEELSNLPDLRKLLPAGMKYINAGGDIYGDSMLRKLKGLLPEVKFVQQYGLTEGGAIVTVLDHEFTSDYPQSVGRPMPLAEVKVTDVEGVVVAADVLGEVWVRSPAVSVGYWRRPEANAEVFVDGWCRTGDLGSLNAAGFLTLKGRAKDMIRSGGENIYPAEIEKHILDFPGVVETAIIGVPDEKYGEVGCCYLEVDRAVDLEELKNSCIARFAKYKVPKYFLVVDELPRTSTGKVRKAVLKEYHYSDIRT
ncbi:hypothetical protein LK10_12815 [Sinomonas humi]|uniref:AMP-dependent synthetase n=1 Tax=Sinomonas humi TaxID=1338436 RepID=A0A0B2AL38_9MICC|nr:hypothetical protein LK10_12815 [Sinomonas humi]